MIEGSADERVWKAAFETWNRHGKDLDIVPRPTVYLVIHRDESDSESQPETVIAASLDPAWANDLTGRLNGLRARKDEHDRLVQLHVDEFRRAERLDEGYRKIYGTGYPPTDDARKAAVDAFWRSWRSAYARMAAAGLKRSAELWPDPPAPWEEGTVPRFGSFDVWYVQAVELDAAPPEKGRGS